ncbi:MAG: glycerol kinase GlpK [Myxococcales bacterium]|nr:glycerol kinase GlpK [Myxococcales bacterium]MCB9627708.1 glycerol kinase GlpK [Sandaracinaceae bacterium]
MSGFILSIDQGTTGSTVVVLSEDARVLGRANREFAQHYPKPGWVEHDLGEIWRSVTEASAEALARAEVQGHDCLAIGITNQRETTVVWDRKTGQPIHRAIVWQDRRTASACEALRDAGHLPLFRARTGLVLDPYFSGTKVAHILDTVPGARARAEAGELAFGTIDSWLVNRLTAGEVHVTDATNASRTLLFDIHRGAWDAELAGLLRVPMAMLPEVRSCSEVYGVTKGVPAMPDGIPIAGMAGDQQAALFGQTCFEVGDAKCTYGTGAFILMNTGKTPVPSEHGLLTTVAWRLGDETFYALEGSAFIAGAAVQWLRDGLGVIASAADIEARAREVESAGDVVFVPALAGLGAPHWDPHARGLIYGLTRDTNVAHLCRATLDGIAYQIMDLVRAMEQDAGASLARLRVDGGACNNDLLMQFQCDMLNAPVDRPVMTDTTALGAAYLAGLGVGLFANLDAIRAAHAVDRSFEPTMAAEERAERDARWQDAVRRARSDRGAA